MTRGISTEMAKFSFAVILSLVLIVSDHKYGYAQAIRSLLSEVVYPLHAIGNVPIEYFGEVADLLTSKRSILEENKRLKKQQLIMASELQKYEALDAENARLRQLLSSTVQLDQRKMITRLVYIGVQPDRHHLVLDKGSREGVYIGQSVLDSHGLTGQVVNVGLLSSTVLLVTDPRHAVPVMINRTGVRAIAEGTGKVDVLRLSHLQNNVDIRVGDLIVSSGLGGTFPIGYPVGRISRINHDVDSPFAQVLAEPAAKLEQSREFLLIWQKEREPPGPLDQLSTEPTGEELARPFSF